MDGIKVMAFDAKTAAQYQAAIEKLPALAEAVANARGRRGEPADEPDPVDAITAAIEELMELGGGE